MVEEYDYTTWLKSISPDDYVSAIRNEVLNCNQTTRMNLGYILNEVEMMLQELEPDSRRINEYVERIRSTTDRITSLLNTAATLYVEAQENQSSK